MLSSDTSAEFVLDIGWLVDKDTSSGEDMFEKTISEKSNLKKNFVRGYPIPMYENSFEHGHALLTGTQYTPF